MNINSNKVFSFLYKRKKETKNDFSKISQMSQMSQIIVNDYYNENDIGDQMLNHPDLNELMKILKKEKNG